LCGVEEEGEREERERRGRGREGRGGGGGLCLSLFTFPLRGTLAKRATLSLIHFKRRTHITPSSH
jgi:hypothetical protein